jgi:hypothetical protein
MTTINDILSMSRVCASSGRVQSLRAGAPVGFSDLQWRQGLDKAVTDGFLLHTTHQGEDRYFLAQPFTTINGDVYRLTLGRSDNAGCIMVHGFNTEGFSHTSNGLAPRQVSQWVKATDIRHPPSQATAVDIEAWKASGFDLPTCPADSDTRKTA